MSIKKRSCDDREEETYTKKSRRKDAACKKLPMHVGATRCHRGFGIPSPKPIPLRNLVQGMPHSLGNIEWESIE